MITYTRHSSDTGAALVTPLADLYEIVYSEPPYEEGPDEVDGFRKRFLEEISRPGFELIAAEDGDRLIGAAYGWIMGSGKWWSNADKNPPAEIVESDKFAVLEWLVQPDWRREGIGAQLMRRLLANRKERYATLASDPRSLARAIYRRAGWRDVAQSKLSWGPSMDLLVVELPLR